MTKTTKTEMIRVLKALQTQQLAAKAVVVGLDVGDITLSEKLADVYEVLQTSVEALQHPIDQLTGTSR
jgi:hypothetical protein